MEKIIPSKVTTLTPIETIIERTVTDLYELGTLKFGDFIYKSGIKSNHYMDLRLAISQPKVLETIGQLMAEKSIPLNFDLVCGVLLAGFPFAISMVLQNNKPLIILRPKAKDHGTQQKIEGNYQKGQTVLVVEDLITSGASTLETIDGLEQQGLIVKDVIIFLNREQGGVKRVQDRGYNVHYLLTLIEFVSILSNQGKITHEQAHGISTFIKTNQI